MQLNKQNLLWFLLRTHVQVISYEISPVCSLQYPYSFFYRLVFVVFLFFLMLTVLLLAAVISLSLLFLMYFSSPCIDASTQF